MGQMNRKITNWNTSSIQSSFSTSRVTRQGRTGSCSTGRSCIKTKLHERAFIEYTKYRADSIEEYETIYQHIDAVKGYSKTKHPCSFQDKSCGYCSCQHCKRQCPTHKNAYSSCRRRNQWPTMGHPRSCLKGQHSRRDNPFCQKIATALGKDTVM